MRNHHLLALALFCVAGAAGATVAVAATGGGPPADNAHISALDQPRENADAIDQRFADAVASSPGALGAVPVDWGKARRTASNAWLIPAGDKLCIHAGTATDGPLACGPRSAVKDGGAWLTSEVAGQGAIVVGAVPDGVSAVTLADRDGTKRGVAVSNNTYSAPLRDAESVTFTGPAGPETTQLSAPAP
jgi:hypothetical protein